MTSIFLLKLPFCQSLMETFHLSSIHPVWAAQDWGLEYMCSQMSAGGAWLSAGGTWLSAGTPAGAAT